MPKSQEFKDELGVKFSPRVYRKGYLFKYTGEDVNGNVSSFHDEKSFFKGFYDHDVFGIFSDLHYSKWDHSYGTTHSMMNVLPDDSSFFEQAWTKSTPSGSDGTASFTLNNVTADRGNLQLTCTTSQTIAYHKTDIINDISTSTGNFTLEWAFKKGNSESSNNNTFTFQVKFGQFHIQVQNKLDISTFKEVGTAGTDITNTNNSSISTLDNGHYNVYRLVFDMQRATKKCVLFINGQERASATKTQTNGSTTDNEVKFGYFATPSSTSRSLIKYVRYHNAAMLPIDVYAVNTTCIASPNSSTGQGTETRFTQSGSFSNFSLALASGLDTDSGEWSANNQSGATSFIRNSDFTTNALGNAFEVETYYNSTSSSVGRTEYKLEDGTRSCKLELFSNGNSTVNAGIRFNGVTVSGIASTTPHKYRIVMRGTGASSAINCWLYVDGVLVESQSNTTSSANNRFSVIYDTTSGFGNSTSVLRGIKLFNRPAHATRLINTTVVAYLNGIDESTTRYYNSNVTLNDLNDLLASPQLSSLQVLQKDLVWGDSGFDAVSALEQRSSNTVFTSSDGSPAWTSIVAPTGISKRDSFTKYSTIYFQTRIPFATLTNELTLMRFHRQLDVSDYVTSWGQSTFERDFISRKINAGDLRITLMNPDDDFDSLRQRPDLWIDALWETWIGAHTDFGDYEYPDFIGKVENILFESNKPEITLEITNLIKTLKDIDINTTYQYPPFSKLTTFAGSVCHNVPVRTDTVDNTVFFLDSKYDVTIDNVYVNGVVQSSGYTVSANAPGKVDFTTAPSGTVTVDLIPQYPFNSSNAGTLIKNIMQREAGLFLNKDIEILSTDQFEEDVDTIGIKNVTLSQIKLFDFIEKITTQSSGTLFISPETQDAIGFELISTVKLDSETISDRNLDPSFHSCTSLTISNPIENVINSIDFTFDTVSPKSSFTYVNRRLVSDYDSLSPIATKKIIDVFGVKSPSRRITNNPNTFFNIITDYEYLDSATDLNVVVDRNFSPFGYRPPVYDLNEVHTNIFIYSFRDVLFLMRNSATIADDTIEITRIQKDYDSLSGTIQGFSNKFIQFGGSIISLLKTYAVPDTICSGSVTSPVCDVTGKVLNPSDPDDVNGYFVATDTNLDPDTSYAGT